MSIADACPGNTPSAAPDDAALPGAVLLQQPRRLVEVLSPLLAEWLDVDGRLVDSHVAIRPYLPGKRCIFELELGVARGGADAGEKSQAMGQIYSGCGGP